MASNLPERPASRQVIEGRATDVTPRARVPSTRAAPTGAGQRRGPAAGVNASRARGSAAPVPRGTSRRQPLYTQTVPRGRGLTGGLSSPQKVLLVAWSVAVGLHIMQDVRLTHDWPCPGPLLRISALYLMLGVLSEAAPSLAAWLGVGFLVAYVTRVGGKEVQQRGTFFGVPVKK